MPNSVLVEQVHMAGRGHEYPNAEIPQALTWNVRAESYDEYKSLILCIYSTLKTRRPVDGTDETYVTSKFCGLSNTQLRDNIRPAHEALGDCRNTPIWLYRLLSMVKDPPTMTRHMVGELATLLTDNNVNTVLKDTFHTPQDSPANEGLPMEYVQRWVIAALEGMVYTHAKTRLGFEFFQLFEDYNKSIQALTISVDDMLLNLTDRATVNQKAAETGKIRQDMIETCEAYVKMKDERKIRLAYYPLQEYREMEAFDFARFRTHNQNGILWMNHVTLQNPDTFSALSVKEIADAAGKLSPLVKEIRGYQPSATDIAHDKAARVKAAVESLKVEMENFLDNTETRSLAKAKSLHNSLTFYKEKCEQLRIDGVQYDQEHLGASPQELSEFYEEIFKYITGEQEEQKKREYRDKIEANEVMKSAPTITLPPLFGINSWLEWKAKLDRIIPFHSSDLIKSTMVRSSLRDKADISRCQNLEYSGIMEYLSARYNDSSQIPRLIDRLLMLDPAKDDMTSYQNLTEFLSIWSQLELHKGTDRLDAYLREKLVPLLLTNSNQCTFLAEQINQEREWKQAQQNTQDEDDSASTTFSIAGGEENEEKRRKNFVSSMKIFAEIVRRIVATQLTTDDTTSSQKKSQRNRFGVNKINQSDRQCPVCSSLHTIDGEPTDTLEVCAQFLDMPVRQRFKVVKSSNFCTKCLFPKDLQHENGCQVSEEEDMRCDLCNRTSHHTLLHFPKSGGDYKRHRQEKQNDSATHSNQTTEDGTTVQVGCITTTQNSTWAKADVPADKGQTMFLSSCSKVNVAITGGQLKVVLSLLDTGCGPNLILTGTAQRLGLETKRTWRGILDTVSGEVAGDFPIYYVPIEDSSGKTHIIAAVGVHYIGEKKPVPEHIFQKICGELEVSPHLVQNTSGPIDVIIGTQSHHLLAQTSKDHPQLAQTKLYHGVALYTTVLSKQYLVIGAVSQVQDTDENRCSRMIQINTCNNGEAENDNADVDGRVIEQRVATGESHQGGHQGEVLDLPSLS